MLFKAHPLKNSTLRQQITQGFGEHPEWYSRFTYDGVALKGHNGIDFGVPTGTEIDAIDDGTVVENTYDPNGFGYYVKLQHAWGESLYGHFSKPGDDAVSAGQSVRAGQIIGLSDDSGFSTGPHLHFGIRVNPYRRDDGWGGFCDPQPYLQEVEMAVPEASLDGIREAAWNTWSVPFNSEAALARYARANNLGAPLTREFTVGNYRCQGFVLGIAYAPIGQWDQVEHTTW